MSGTPNRRPPDWQPAGSGLDEAGSWTPAFPGQRRPFELGNPSKLVHGAYRKPANMGERPQEIADALRPHVPGDSVAYEPLLCSYGIVLTRIERAAAALEAVGESVDDLASAEKLEKSLRLWVSSAVRLADALGLSPSSAARIAKDVGGAAAHAVHLELLEKYRGAA